MLEIKRLTLLSLATLCFFIFLGAQTVYCEVISNQKVIEEIDILKAKINQLENKLSSKNIVPKAKKISHDGAIGVKDLNDRVNRIEEFMESAMLGKWANKMSLSGLVEVEANYESALNDHSDINLATVELGLDADISKYIKGHLLFLWEEDDTDPINMEEGFITLDGSDEIPIYLDAGKMYLPFGYFESHFIRDPLTLELGEINETAFKLGLTMGSIDFCAAIFNGDINEINENDDLIDNYILAIIFNMPENIIKDIRLIAGLSYISNLSDTDGLQDILAGNIEEYAGGLNSFLSVSWKDTFFLEMEYVGALDNINVPGSSQNFEPNTWNLELAYMIQDGLEVAISYEGSDDTMDIMPEDRFGAVVSYELFNNLSTSLEYLYSEFEEQEDSDLITAQIAIEF